MLTKFQKLCIDELVNTHTCGIVKDEKKLATFKFESDRLQHFLESDTEVSSIPEFKDMFETAITKLRKVGFSGKLVSPKKANCIIVVYKLDSFEHMGCEHWFYGTKVFFKSLLCTKSLDGMLLVPNSFEVDVWMFQDEKVSVIPNRAYYYLKLS